jgi:hypothetical protein
MLKTKKMTKVSILTLTKILSRSPITMGQRFGK